MRRSWMIVLVAVAAGAAAVGTWSALAGPPRTAGPLVHEAYVWQRAWTPLVSEAVSDAERDVGGIVALAAEVGWSGAQARVTRVALNHRLLRERRCGVGLAIRIGSYAHGRAPDAVEPLAKVAAAVLAEAGEAGVRVCELQIDFDAAESRLDAYRAWVEAIRRRVGPVPVVITALPSWLDQRSFARLARAADGFVLQVHSLQRPSPAGGTLCDAGAARRAVERAARVGAPFRVALPTYGYVVGFDDGGKLMGVWAEGPAPQWTARARLRELVADPAEMAELVRAWTADRPANLCGIIWYRLPVRTDALNWSMTTFRAVMAGRVPRRELATEVVRGGDGAHEVWLVNRGEADAPARLAVAVRWSGARVIGVDALNGYRSVIDDAGSLRLSGEARPGVPRLRPGQRAAIGWLRLDMDTEVQADVSSIEAR